jgi:dienelactone hydrolase
LGHLETAIVIGFCARFLFVFGFAVLASCASVPVETQDIDVSALPPSQPEVGPGGEEYRHDKVVETCHGWGGKQYWLFEPGSPKPESAPVVIFNHGWAGMLPRFYRRWIRHIVKRGSIVIYPRYQRSILTPSERFTPNLVAAVRAALEELQRGGHVRPDLDRVAAVGHSMGGVLSANLAAAARRERLPELKALMCIEPGMGPRDVLEDFSEIPADTLMLGVLGEDDSYVTEEIARRILTEAVLVKKENKNLITVLTDNHGKPALSADHFAPTDRNLNALSWYGFWKWFDALCDAAFYGKNREYALGNTPEQRFMGKWSDGRPVKEPRIENLKAIESKERRKP